MLIIAMQGISVQSHFSEKLLLVELSKQTPLYFLTILFLLFFLVWVLSSPQKLGLSWRKIQRNMILFFLQLDLSFTWNVYSIFCDTRFQFFLTKHQFSFLVDIVAYLSCLFLKDYALSNARLRIAEGYFSEISNDNSDIKTFFI